MNVTYEDVRNSEEIRTYIKQADESLKAIGYTEHSFAHCTKVAKVAGDLLEKLGYDAHEVELARIAGFHARYRQCGEPHRPRPKWGYDGFSYFG